MLSTGALLSCGNTFGICLKRKKTHCLCICFSLFRWYWNVLAHWACFPNTMGFGLFLSEVEGGCFVMWLWAPDAYAVITRISMVNTDLQLQPRNVFCDREIGILRDQCMMSLMVFLWSIKDMYHVQHLRISVFKKSFPFMLTEINLMMHLSHEVISTTLLL